MRISTRGRYALQALTVIAAHPQGEKHRLKDVARDAGLSEGYPEQLFLQLKDGGLIIGMPGAGGGSRSFAGCDHRVIAACCGQAEGRSSEHQYRNAYERRVAADCVQAGAAESGSAGSDIVRRAVGCAQIGDEPTRSGRG